MRLYLMLHFFFWFALNMIVVNGTAVWAGMSLQHVVSCLPFIMVISHLYVAVPSLFIFLTISFVKTEVK